jgi:serine/threonine protein kinase
MDPEEQERFRDVAQKRVGMVLRGKYHLDAVLGMGGMAVVYRATHRNRAEYAVKMLLPEHSTNESIRRRFLREGYAANSVKHSGAVRVVDDDETEDGVAFLVLELLDGMACDRLAAALGGRVPMAATCAIGLQVLDVLEAAHSQGIVHRDIKPGNLFVLRDGAVKVLDFGIARVRESMTSAFHSTGGMLLGTPAFMAPEQALGGASDVDERVDIWALGASLFALASGVTVHEGESGQRMLVRLLTQSPRSLAVVAPGASREIVEVIDRALSFDRDRRWPSAREMRTALDQASRAAFNELPSCASLASLVASCTAASPTPADSMVRRFKPDPSPRERTPEGPEGPTLPDAAAQAVIETSRPVSRDGSPARAPPRLQVGGIAAVAAVGVLMVATAMFVVSRPGPVAGLSGLGSDDASHPISGTAGTPAIAPAVDTNDRRSSPPERPVPALTVPEVQIEVAAPSSLAKGLPGAKAPEGSRPRFSPTLAAAPSDAGSAPRAAREHAAPAPDCKPPFYYDAQWNRVFKKECLQN